MVLEQIAGVMSGAASTLVGAGFDSIDMVNGTFGSVVAVTGDAHQAQVAQDIFRQEVRIERSLRVREDIRDAHQLMIENVQSQLLMGNIVLGICFTLLIEGKPSNAALAPVLVQELWAVFSVWSISLSFLSVWFALQYQEQVSVSSRKRLLEKYRITTPNDEVVGRMGGLSLAEKVSQLHQRGLNEFSEFLETRTGLQGTRDYLCERAAELVEALPDGPIASCRAGACQPRPAADAAMRTRAHSKESAFSAQSRSICKEVRGPDMTYQDSIAPPLEVHVCREHQWASADELHASRRQPLRHDPDNAAFCVRVTRGTRAWYDKDKGNLLNHYIVDLPDFLDSETLVRCPWEMPDNRHRSSIRLMVRGTATLYVAAQWPGLDSAHAFRGQGSHKSWADEEMPMLSGGRVQFHKVEGFSLLVSEDKIELPLYRAALEEPDSSGWRRVKLRFNFEGAFAAPVIILRQGTILTSEEDWPVRDFMNELDTIQPLRDHSMNHMSHGLMNLLLAAFCAHLGRVLTDRPWPMCRFEVIFVLVAFCPAVLVTMKASGVMRNLFNTELSTHPRFRDYYKRWQQLPGADSKEDAPKSPPRLSVEVEEPQASGQPFHFERPETPNSMASLQRSLQLEQLEQQKTLAAAKKPSMALAFCAGQETRPPPLDDDAIPSEHPPGEIRGCFASCGAVEQHVRFQEDIEVVVDEGDSWTFPTGPRRLEPFPEVNQEAGSGGELIEPCFPSGADEQPIKDPSARWSETTPDVLDVDDKIRPRRCRCSGHFEGFFARRYPTRSCEAFASWKKGWTWIAMFYVVVRSLWTISVGSLFVRSVSSQLGESGMFKGAEEGGAQGRRCSTLGAGWSVEKVLLPSPFFSPTAAAAPWLASDWLLAPLPGRPAGSADGADDGDGGGGARLVRLPEAARGLFVAGGGSRLLLAGEEEVHVLDVASFVLRGSSAVDSTLSPSLGVVFRLPRAQLGRLAAVAAAALPLSGAGAEVGSGDTVVFAMAPEAGGVYLSAGANLTAASLLLGVSGAVAPTLEVALRVPRRPGAAAVRSLHFCGVECASVGPKEPTLWAADAAGCLTATGLETGSILGSWLWAPPSGASSAPVALTGNATTLLLVGPCGAGAAVHSASFEELLAGPSQIRC